MKISIALCTYNGERFLPEQLDSFLQQTKAPSEVVVCDDGSKDRTLALLEEFSKKAPFPVRVVRNERNLGYSQNFAKALGLCTGDLICLSDQDDIWLQKKLEKMAAAMSKGDFLAVFSDEMLVDENGGDLGETYWQRVQFPEGEKTLFRKGRGWLPLLRRNMIAGNSVGIRKDLLAEILPIPELWIHDYWIMSVASALGKIQVIDEPLLKYRQHTQQNIGTPYHGPIQRFLGRIERSWQRDLSENRKEAFRVKSLLERLQRNPKIGNELLLALKEKQKHYERRSELPSSRLTRIAKIFAEYKSGNYQKFAAGKSSAVKDLLSR